MKIYYAHCVALYGTPQETRDLETLNKIFEAVVINPGEPVIEMHCQEIRRRVHEWNVNLNPDAPASMHRNAGEEIMNCIFKPMVDDCHALAFRSLPDGRIPAGVAKEIAWALAAGKPIIELPSNFTGRVMTVDHTREYLREVGQR